MPTFPLFPKAHDGGVAPAQLPHITPCTPCVVVPSRRRAWDDPAARFPIRAGGAYTGPFSRKCQAYAERFHAGAWCILDPHNGFMWPDELIYRPHDRCIYQSGVRPLDLTRFREDASDRGLYGHDVIIALGGQCFVSLMEKLFSGSKVSAPLAGTGGIGRMMRVLDHAISSDERL